MSPDNVLDRPESQLGHKLTQRAVKMEAKMEEAKRRCRSVEEIVENNLKLLNPSCKQTLLRLVRSELSFLSRFSCHTYPDPNLPLSVNIGHLESVVHILQQPCISGVSRVCKPIPLSPGDKRRINLKGVHVDIVCTLNGDPVWFIVSDRNPKCISWRGNASSRDKGLKMRIEDVLDAARSSISLRPSSIILFFSNGLENDILEHLRDEFGPTDYKLECSSFDFGFSEEFDGEWINILARSYEKASLLEMKVDGPGSSISSCSSIEVNGTLLNGTRSVFSVSGEDVGKFVSFNSFISLINLSFLKVKNPVSALRADSSSKPDLINFDTTALIAVVSGISNGNTEKILAMPESELRSRFKSNFDFVIAQVMSEIQNPIHMELSSVISGKGGIICETVCSEFKELVSMCGGANEKSRANHLLKHLIVVPDSPSTRMMSLPTTRKLALKNKIAFGTGDYWHAPTLTANMAFVRAVSQTGMSLFTIEHRPRALTGI